MADAAFILAPETTTIRVELDPVRPLLNSLALLPIRHEYPGLDQKMFDLADRLSDEQSEKIRLVFKGFHGALSNYEHTWRSFPEFMDFIAEQDPQEIVLNAADELVCNCEAHLDDGDEFSLPQPQDLIDSYEIFMEVLKRLYAEKPLPEEAFLQEWHHLLNHPTTAHQMITAFLHEIWDSVLEEEWGRAVPALTETVEAFQQLDLSGLTALEATRVVTGRDLAGNWMGEVIQKARHLVFTPSPYIGPYLSKLEANEITYIFFRPRLPEGYHQQSAALGRSELLILLSALADDTRLRIIELFNQHEELCAQDIIKLLDLSQSAASRHLRQLTATNFITERRLEGAKCYSLNRGRFETTIQAIQGFISGR